MATTMQLFLSAFIVTSSMVCAENIAVKIFHINDLLYDIFQVKDGGSIDCLEADTTCFGGLLRLQEHVYTDILTEPPPGTAHLWLNAGNVLGGPAFDVLKFDVAPAISNLSFHASALGPEVFKYGLMSSYSYTDTLNDTLVASNIKHVTDVAKSVFVPLAGDCHAALVGFMDKTKTDSWETVGVEIEDEVKAITDEIAAIKAAQPDKKFLFIALGSSSAEVAKNIAGIVDVDIVVFSGGDIAEEVPKLNYFESVVVPINSTTNKTNYVVSVIKDMTKLEERFLIGTLEFALDDLCKMATEAPVAGISDYLKGNQTDNVDSVEFIHVALDRMLFMNDVVVYSKVSLLPANDVCKMGECALGDLIADAMVAKINEVTTDESWVESVKLAVFPAYLIQNQMNVTGEITAQELYNFLLKDEYIYTINVTGKALKEMFDVSIEKNEDRMENYLQVSEYLRVEFDFYRKEVTKLEAMSTSSDTMSLTPVDLYNDKVFYQIAVPYSMLYNTSSFAFLRDSADVYHESTVAEALVSHVAKSTGSFLTLPLTGSRTKEDTHITELCVSNTGEVIILTLFVLALLTAFFIGIWKFVLPKYRQRRGSTTQLIP